MSAFLILFLVATVDASSAPAPPGGQAKPQPQVTFTKDIAPILQRSCQGCHRPGSMAPMSLLSYEDVRPWARAIKLRTALREMPPWFIEKNVGIQNFKNDPSLSDDEIAMIARWADAGAPRGNPADMPPPRQFADQDKWSIGTPDLIVSSPVVTLKAVAPDFWGPLDSSPSGLTETRYIKAVEVKEFTQGKNPASSGAPGKGTKGDLSLFAVHHAQIRTEDAQSGEPANGERTAAGSSFSLVYEVGQNAMVYPDAVGVTLAAHSSITYDVHMHSVGEEIPVRFDTAFKFHPKGYKPKYSKPARLAAVFPSFDLDIPGGENNVRIDGVYTLSEPWLMTTFEPHLHSSGKRMCVAAIYPNGVRQMLNCAGYNHNWVKTYAYADEVAPLLPTGTTLHLTAWYDNTARNPRVVDPRNWKGFGDRSIEDMFGFLPTIVPLTEEEYKREVTERKTKAARTPTHNNNN
jgi:hypothetical protein